MIAFAVAVALITQTNGGEIHVQEKLEPAACENAAFMALHDGRTKAEQEAADAKWRADFSAAVHAYALKYPKRVAACRASVKNHPAWAQTDCEVAAYNDQAFETGTYPDLMTARGRLGDPSDIKWARCVE